MIRAIVVLAGFVNALAGLAQAQQIRVAVAANMQGVFEQVAKTYAQANPGVRLVPSYGSSGTFTQQIVQGAPFDIFMSADLDFPKRLQRQGLIEEGTLKTYAVGKLVLFVPSRLGLKATSLQLLQDPKITRLIIANPDTAPYGRAAVQALTRAGIYEQVKGKIALAQNISQAAQLTLAAGDAGFIAPSAIYGPIRQQGTWLMVPQTLFEPIEQALVLVKGRARPEVRAFYLFLSSPEANRIYKAWGYDVP
jgi:molybdate transport system substrate-binding protein